mmetsp:Transcript_457/g.2159  ORF Transcript_457/g.2159 Transcript_457/m.2159 type:complete len:407 (+) Transcript_457:580-1800(+)
MRRMTSSRSEATRATTSTTTPAKNKMQLTGPSPPNPRPATTTTTTTRRRTRTRNRPRATPRTNPAPRRRTRTKTRKPTTTRKIGGRVTRTGLGAEAPAGTTTQGIRLGVNRSHSAMVLPVASGSATAGTGARLRRALAAAVTWSRCAAVDRPLPGAISAIGEIPEVRPRCHAAHRLSAPAGTTAGDAGDAVDPRTALEGIPRVRPLATSAAIGTHTVTEGALRPGQNEIVSHPNETDSHPLVAAIACVGHPRRVAQPRRRRPALIATPRLPWTRPPRFSSPDPRSTSCAASAPTAPGRARVRTWTARWKPCAKHAAPSSASGSGAAGTRLASSRVARRRRSPTPTPTKDRRTPSSDSSTNATKSWNARIRWGSYPTARRRARSGARTSTRAATGACRRRGSATSRR